MGLFDSGSEPEIVEQAKGGSVTEGRLFEKSARLIQRLHDKPIAEYLDREEQPHYIFSGPSTGLEIHSVAGTEQISPDPAHHAFAVVTDRQVHFLIGHAEGDRTERITYDEITHVEFDSSMAKYRMVFGIVDGECEFHTDNTTEKEISEAVEYIIERIPESEADAEPRTDLTRTDELDAKSSDEGTRPYPEEMAQEAPGKKVTLDFLTDDRYLGQQTPYEYLDDEQPKYLISQGTPREVNGKMRITLQLLATDRRLLLFADDPVVASKREKYGKFEIDSFGLQHVVTFRYKDIEDIRLSEGRLSDALVWESKSHTFKLKDFTNDDAEVESFIHYVKQQISQDSTANRVGRLVSAAESETVTGDRLRNRDGLILDKLDSDEQPHYILEGNPIYGVKIEGGASMDDQSAGLTSPIKTLTIRSIWAVLTDSRALLLVVKSGGVNSWSVPYDSITAVDRQEKATGYPLVFHTHGRTYYVDVSKELSSAQETELLEEAMNFVRDRVKSQTTSDSDDNESTSALDKLEQLKQLHDDGVITEEEFEEKKTELLEDI